jgi:hypothetical protein
MLKFQIAQHSRDSELMKSILTNLGCGRIELNLGRSAVYSIVTKFKDVSEKIIPFFDKYPLQAVKDFEDFKRVTKLMENKAHLTKEGLSQIHSIKSKMNFQRDSN